MRSLTDTYNGECAFEEGDFEEMDNESYDSNLPLSAELGAIHLMQWKLINIQEIEEEE